MKKFLLFLTFFSCRAMQMGQTHDEQHVVIFHDDHEVPTISVEIILERMQQAERQLSDIRERRRYEHKKKLAIIALASSVVGSITAVIVYLTK